MGLRGQGPQTLLPPTPIPYHGGDGFTGSWVICLLQDGLEEQRVLGEALVRFHQHVAQLQAAALLLLLGPLWHTGISTGTAPAQPQPRSPPSHYRHVGAEELAVPQQCPHVLHAALLLHAIPHIGLEEGPELGGHKRVIMQHTAWPGSPPWHGIPTHHLEGIKEVNGVKQCPSPSCLGQH